MKFSAKQLVKKIRHDHPFLFWTSAGIAGFLVLGLSFYLYIAYLLPVPDSLLNAEQVGSRDRIGD